MRYVWKLLGWVFIISLPFLIVMFCVWVGAIFGFSDVVSSAVAVGLMLLGLTYELRDRFTSIDKDLHSLKERLTSIETDPDSLKGKFDLDDDELDALKNLRLSDDE
jgi:hypothetical protein